MTHAQAEPVRLPRADTQPPQGLELRHLRYFVAVADAGTFTRAAERLFIAQPTLSQQIRRLEQVVGTPLLHRGRGASVIEPAMLTITQIAGFVSRSPGVDWGEMIWRHQDGHA